MAEQEGIAAKKAAWRRRFRAIREETPATTRTAASRRIVARLRAMPEVASARTVHLFWPLPGEVDLRPLAAALVAAGTGVVLPVVVGDRRLAHRRFEGEASLVPSRFGVRQPSDAAPAVDPAALDVVMVPALALGRDGSRLGYGGGYYDAFLSATPAFRVGVAPAACLVPAVPTEPHDARLDAVVTEAETLRIGRSDLRAASPSGPATA